MRTMTFVFVSLLACSALYGVIYAAQGICVAMHHRAAKKLRERRFRILLENMQLISESELSDEEKEQAMLYLVELYLARRQQEQEKGKVN